MSHCDIMYITSLAGVTMPRFSVLAIMTDLCKTHLILIKFVTKNDDKHFESNLKHF